MPIAFPEIKSGPPVFGKGGFYDAFGAKELFEYAMTFCCPIDLLLWRRVCRLAKRAAEHHWDHGMIEQLVQQFCDHTGKPREYLDAVRKAGGFFTGPRLTCMVVALRGWGPNSGAYDHACDFLLPAAELGADESTPSGMFKRRATIINPKMLDSNVSEMFLMPSMRVTQVQRLSVGMMQTSNNNNVSVPLYERIRITDKGRDEVVPLRYIGVTLHPIRFAATCSPLPFERCLFDGKRLLIHNVESLIQRKGLYTQRNYMIFFQSFQKHLDTVPAYIQKVWAPWGFVVELPRQVPKGEYKSPADSAVLHFGDEEEEELEDPIFDHRHRRVMPRRSRTYGPHALPCWQRWR